MSEILRTVKMSDEQADRIYAALESDDSAFLARIIQDFLERHALQRAKAWSEICRIAGVDREKEGVKVSHLTKEILVYKKSDEEEGEVWKVEGGKR
jgi:hypothetical protein